MDYFPAAVTISGLKRKLAALKWCLYTHVTTQIDFMLHATFNHSLIYSFIDGRVG